MYLTKIDELLSKKLEKKNVVLHHVTLFSSKSVYEFMELQLNNLHLTAVVLCVRKT